MSEKEYTSTLHLPKTDFQMKANLPTKEPKYIKKWTEEKIYEKGLEKNKNGETFILHDGPPYANGNTHIGHALNKILKDIIVKYKTFRGFKSPYVPGWDTHGLPIELQVVKEVGVAKAREMSALEIRKLCEKYARKWVGIQKEQFIRLGVLGDWDNPYLTLDPRFEAKQLELFGEIYENGYIFKGLKPVYWSPATETALAEAEIEYYDHVSPSIYVRMQANKDLLDKIGFNEDAYVLIWTTTPWTLPANVAICLNENFDYGLYKTEKGNLILAKDLAESAFKDIGIENAELIKEFKGKDLEYTTYKHPFLERTGLVILGDHVTADAGTGAVHTAPGHGQDDYVVGLTYKLPVISPIDHRGCLTEEAGDLFKGLVYSEANKVIIKHLTETGHILKMQEISHSYPHDWRSKTPVIFRATEQWFIRMDFKFQRWGADLLEAIGLSILRVCTYLIFFIQKIWSYILIVLGPIAIGMALIPGFESSLTSWVSKFININLYTFVAFTIINIGQQLIISAYTMEIDRYELMINSAGNVDSATISAFINGNGMLHVTLFTVVAYIVTGIGVLMTPTIADSIVSAGGAGVMTKMKQSAGKGPSSLRSFRYAPAQYFGE